MVQSELAAVNAMLTAIGDTPVNDLTVIHSDIQAAQNMLEEHSVNLQSEGWYFNTEVFSYTLDTDGKQALPTNTLFADTSNTDLVRRGSYVYDLKNHTFNLSTRDLTYDTIKLVYQLTLAELPPLAYNVLVMRAKMQFITELEADTAKVQLLARQEQNTYFQLKKLNLQFSEPCALQSPAAVKLLRGTQYYSMYRR